MPKKKQDWRKRPRKPAEKLKSATLGSFRCTAAELATIKARAEAAGMQVAEWVIWMLTRE